MKMEYDNNLVYMMNQIILSDEDMKKYNEYLDQYKDKSDKYLLREIVRVKGDVSKEVIQQHVKNLELLSQMNGFVADEHRQKMDILKRILNTDIPRNYKSESQAAVETQFFVGSSLLLWFLLLTTIWRKPYYRRPVY